MPAIPLARDPRGAPIMPGLVKRTIAADFGMLSTALPAGISTATPNGATVVSTTMATTRGEVVATLPVTTGAVAQINFPQVDLSKVEAVMLTAEGIIVTGPANRYLALDATTHGLNVFNGYHIQRKGGSSTYLTGRIWAEGKTSTASLLLLCSTRQAYYLEGDQVAVAVDLSAAGGDLVSLGPVLPRFEMTRTAATDGSVTRIARMTLTTWSY